MREQHAAFELFEEILDDRVNLVARKKYSADYLDFFEAVIKVARTKAEDVFARSDGISIFVSKNSNVMSQHLVRIYFEKVQQKESGDKLARLIFFGK